MIILKNSYGNPIAGWAFIQDANGDVLVPIAADGKMDAAYINSGYKEPAYITFGTGTYGDPAPPLPSKKMPMSEALTIDEVILGASSTNWLLIGAIAAVLIVGWIYRNKIISLLKF